MSKIIAKKILPFLVLGIMAVGLVAPIAVSAADAPTIPGTCNVTTAKTSLSTTCGGLSDSCSIDTDANCAICCTMNTIYVVTKWLFVALLSIAIIMIIYGGFTYVTAGGNPEKTKTGQQILTFAIIGIAIALLAKMIPMLVKFIVGVS